MPQNLSPETTIALQQFAQGDSSKLDKSLKALKEAKDMAKIEHAAQEFEAVFVSEMIKPMFSGIKTDGLFGGGQAEETFRSMMIQEYGKLISQTGQIGISTHVKEAMIQMQAGMNIAKTKIEKAEMPKTKMTEANTTQAEQQDSGKDIASE